MTARDLLRADGRGEMRRNRARRYSLFVTALGATIGISLCMSPIAAAQSCNQSDTACIDTPGPLMPAQVIDFRVEAGATNVASAFFQVQDGQAVGSGYLKEQEPASTGSPGGHDAYRAVLPGLTDRITWPGEPPVPQKPLIDGPIVIDVRYRSPTTGEFKVAHEAEYEVIAPTTTLSASIVAPSQQLLGQLSFEARREVRVTATLTLSGKKSGSGKGWRKFASAAADEIVATGPQEVQTPPRKRKCPRRYDKCKANLEGGIFTEAAGRWWSSGDAAAKLKYG